MSLFAVAYLLLACNGVLLYVIRRFLPPGRPADGMVLAMVLNALAITCVAITDFTSP